MQRQWTTGLILFCCSRPLVHSHIQEFVHQRCGHLNSDGSKACLALWRPAAHEKLQFTQDVDLATINGPADHAFETAVPLQRAAYGEQAAWKKSRVRKRGCDKPSNDKRITRPRFQTAALSSGQLTMRWQHGKNHMCVRRAFKSTFFD